MMNDDAVTGVVVVLPVYNTSRYLRECLNSLLTQTYSYFKVIAVDDGSTDDSPEILDEYARLDPRLIVVHKKNKGVSAARNCGMREIEKLKLSPEFIYFLDSDDKLSSTFLERLVLAADGNCVDVAVGQVVSFDKKKEVNKRIKQEAILLSPDDYAELYLASRATIAGSMRESRFLGNKLFRYHLVAGCYFNESFNTAEDQDWMITHVLPRVNAVVLETDSVYLYRLRKSSLSHCKSQMQGVETFLSAFDKCPSYSPKMQKGIVTRLCETLFKELQYSFCNNDVCRREEARNALKSLRNSSFYALLPVRQKKRLHMLYLPQSVQYFYFSMKERKENNHNKESYCDYFD